MTDALRASRAAHILSGCRIRNKSFFAFLMSGQLDVLSTPRMKKRLAGGVELIRCTCASQPSSAGCVEGAAVGAHDDDAAGEDPALTGAGRDDDDAGDGDPT